MMGDDKGLVKLVDLRISQDEKEAMAAINDSGDRRISCFTVPLEEIEIKP